MDKQRKEARKLARELPPKKKLEHIWTYYKWWIISAVIVIVVVAGTVYHAVTKPKYDLEIVLYSEKYIANERVEAMERYLSEQVEDRDGDGKQSVKIYLASPAGMGSPDDAQMAVMSKLTTEVVVGSYPVFLFDDTYYEILQQDVYSETMEVYRDMTKQEELQGILKASAENHLYWATRSLYQGEEEDEDAVRLHDTAVETELRVFGPRED